MPRIRSIKPQFWLDEDLATICRDARFMFVGLWNIADDGGVFEWRPQKIKAQLFPYDDDITTKHQMIQHPSKYRFADVPQVLLSESALRTTTKEKDKEEGKGGEIVEGEGKGKEIPEKNAEHINDIFDLWNTQGIIQHKKLTSEIKRAIEIRLKDYSIDEICQAMKNYAEIVKDEQYYFKYKWTLKDFLKRGLEKFMDLDVAKQNYKTDDGAGKQKATRQENQSRRYQATN